jgi:Ala-tRNA(Pro) deacylase
MDILSFLTEHRIPSQHFEHEAVMTCEEAAKLPPMPGTPTKNLFLRDEKGKRHFLVVVPHDKQVKLRALEPLFGCRRLGFASPERLKKYLGLEPGSVTILGLVNDAGHHVELFIDADLWKDAEALQCHPLRNTATLVIPREGIERFLAATGHQLQVTALPEDIEKNG